MTTLSGAIREVILERTGSTVVEDSSSSVGVDGDGDSYTYTAIGATTLPMDDCYDFEEIGGQICIDLEGDTTTDPVISYTGIDTDLALIYLTVPLAVNVPVGTFIYVWPESIEKRAWVTVMEDEDEDPVQARVPFAMNTILPEGIRTDDTGYETVSIDLDGQDWVITDIIGKIALIDGTLIDPFTVIPISALSDGIAPSTAPVVVAYNLEGKVNLSWATVPNRDAVRYNVYASTSSGFLPGSGNKVDEVLALTTNVALLGGAPLSTSVLTYFRVAAVDADGEGPYSNEVSGTPLLIVVFDSTPPSVPTGLASIITTDTFGRATAAVSWTAVVATDLAQYILRYRKVGTTNYTQMSVDNSTVAVVVPLTVPYVNYEFQVASSDFQANYSAFSGTITATGSTNAAPATVAGLVLVPGRESITASWTESADDDVRNGYGLYEVQFATNVGFTTGLLTYRTGANSITVTGLVAGTAYWSRVRAVDSGGLTSVAYSTIVTTTTGTYAGVSTTDGAIPSTSPAATVSGGIGYLNVVWLPITNNDAVTYEIHLSTSTGFTPNSGTKWGESTGTFVTIENLPQTTTPLAYGTTYYIKLLAKDKDGSAAAYGTQGSGTIVQAQIADIGATARQLGVPTIYLQTTQPSSGMIKDDIWFDTDDANKEYTYTGSAWVSVQDGSIATGDAASVVTAATDATAKTDLVNNPTRTGTTARWAPNVGSISIVDDTFNDGTTIKAMKWDCSGDGQNYSDYFDVDTSKAYEISMWVRDTADVGASIQRYLGLGLIKFDGGAQSVEPVNVTNGTVSAPSANFYFTYTAAPTLGSYVQIVCYVLPVGTTGTDAIGLGQFPAGDTIIGHARFLPNTKRMRLRYLNWANAGTPRDLYAAMISVKPVSMDTIRAGKVRSDAALTAAGTAQTAANGKNTIITSTSAATGTTSPVTGLPLIAGDVWFQKSGSLLIAQWEYTTSWQSRTLDSAIIANLNVGKLVSGDISAAVINVDSTGQIKSNDFVTGTTGWSLSNAGLQINTGAIEANALRTNSVFTKNLILGTVGTPGVIQSYDYVASTTGFKLSSAGLDIATGAVKASTLTAGTIAAAVIVLNSTGQIKSNDYNGTTTGWSFTNAGLQILTGTVSAATLQANSAFIQTLNVGSGGSIQSTGYTGGGTTGFSLSNTGLIIKGTNNVVAVEAVAAGTITAKTINIGATGVLNIDSTGQVKSNNYALNTTGYKLSNTGLEINDGSIDAKAIKTSSLLAATITLGTSGIIQSSDYVAGTTGFKLDSAGLDISTGSIKAKAIELKTSFNLMPWKYSTFEATGSSYVFATTAAETIAFTNDVPLVGGQSQALTITPTSLPSRVHMGESITDYNIRLENNSSTYILSFYGKAASAITVTPQLKYSDTTTLTLTAQSFTTSYQRFTMAVAAKTGITGALLSFSSGTNAITYYIDAIQLEEKVGLLTTATQYNPPSSTIIDGGSIRTGFLSADLIDVGTITVDKIDAELIEVSEAYIQTGYVGALQFNQLDGSGLNQTISIDAGGVINIGERITIADVNAVSVDGTRAIGGIVIWADDNHTEMLVQLHPDGSIFKGAIDADDLTVITSLNLLNSILFASGSTSTLQNGIADPLVAPVLAQTGSSSTWPSVPSGHDQAGICWDATDSTWWRLTFKDSDRSAYAQPVSVAGVAGTGREVPTTGTVLGNDSYATVASGIAVIGTDIYYLLRTYDDGTRTVRLCRATKTVDGNGDWTYGSHVTVNVTSSGTGEPGMGSDGTYIYVVYPVSSGGALKVAKYSVGPLTLVGSCTITGGGASNDDNFRFVSVIAGDAGFAATKLVMANSSNVEVYSNPTFTNDTPTYDAALTFTLDSTVFWGGLTYKYSGSTGFYSTHNDLKLWYWSSYYPSASEKFWAKYIDKASSLGTRPSPESSLAIAKRRWAAASLPTAPTGITSAELYVGYGTVSPGASMWKRTETFVGRSLFMVNGKVTSGTLIGTQKTVSNKALTSNIATLTTSTTHGYAIGQTVDVYGVGAPFDGEGYTILTVPLSTTFTYAKTNSNVTSAAATGTTVMTTNNLGGTPAVLQSEAGGFIVRGDGTGAWPSIAIAHGALRQTAGSETSVATSTTTKIQGFATVIDTLVGMTYASGNWTVLTAGIYQVHASLAFATDGTGNNRGAFLYVNGVEQAATNAPPGTIVNRSMVSMTRRLAANDVVSLYGYQSSGANLNTHILTAMSITRIGA